MSFLRNNAVLKNVNWPAQWNSFWRGFTVMLVFGLFAVGVPGMMPGSDDANHQALGVARDHLFDFAAWEADAAIDKIGTAMLNPAEFMGPDEQVQYVRDYLALVQEIQNDEAEITQFYISPNIYDPDFASAPLRTRRDALRAEQISKQALAESIIESQIAETLHKHGLGVGGEILPPVSIRFTQLPTIMIVSRRDRIERTGSYALEHGLTVDEMEHLENGVDAEVGVSSLIVPLGGLAVYPAMLIETSYLPHVYEVGAHEWMHHYLTFYPLGINYGTTSELYTMNETVASIVGEDIGWEILNQYYPDLAGPPPDYTPQPPQPAQERAPADPAAFDFRAAMRETRIHVDELLSAGKIDEAEEYMEARRVIFVQNGYQIRKLNQAYFAFYGSYADEPGATGSDPIGPALRDLRFYSGSLIEFIRRVRAMTSSEDLQRELTEARTDYEASH
jgi:hypothetical protein